MGRPHTTMPTFVLKEGNIKEHISQCDSKTRLCVTARSNNDLNSCWSAVHAFGIFCSTKIKYKTKPFQAQKNTETSNISCVNLWVEVCLYILQYLIQLGKASGWQLTVDGPIWADAAHSHVHVGAVHLRRATDRSLVYCTFTRSNEQI